jgi:hypothetical protein
MVVRAETNYLRAIVSGGQICILYINYKSGNMVHITMFSNTLSQVMDLKRAKDQIEEELLPNLKICKLELQKRERT